MSIFLSTSRSFILLVDPHLSIFPWDYFPIIDLAHPCQVKT